MPVATVLEKSSHFSVNSNFIVNMCNCIGFLSFQATYQL